MALTAATISKQDAYRSRPQPRRLLDGVRTCRLGIDLFYDVEGFTRFFEANKEKYWADYEKPLTAFFQPEQLPEVTEGLLERGYAESEVCGILGEPLMHMAPV